MEQRRKLIMTVDDTENLRRLIKYNLRQAGYDVIDAGDGETAFRLLGAHKPDLILLDIRMPGWDGFEFLDHLRKYPAAAKTPVIMLTALSKADDVERALKLGAVDYLVKPFDPTLLLSKVSGVFRTLAATAPKPAAGSGRDRRALNRAPVRVPLDPSPGGFCVDLCEDGLGFTTQRIVKVGEVITLQATSLFHAVGLNVASLRIRIVHLSRI